MQSAIMQSTKNLPNTKNPAAFCQSCQNFSACRNIKSQLESAKDATVHSVLKFSALKKVGNFKEHLYRDGYNFPFVQKPASCWLHDKDAVVHYREICLNALITSEASAH